MASMNYFDSDMYNSTNTVVYFDEEDGNLYLCLRRLLSLISKCIHTNNAIAYRNYFFLFITQYAFYIDLYMFISRNMKIFILIIVLISILNMKTTFSWGGGDGGGGRDGWPRKSW
jgi:hypothetical protein